MRITYKGDYALKTILDLAVHYGSSPVTIHDLAGRADIPIKFLEQILLDLKRGRFVESKRGKVGGYLLARSPSKITLGEVVRFIDGPINPIACVDNNYTGCGDRDECVFREIWRRVTAASSHIVDSITFKDLAEKQKRRKSSLSYHI